MFIASETILVFNYLNLVLFPVFFFFFLFLNRRILVQKQRQSHVLRVQPMKQKITSVSHSKNFGGVEV